MTIAAQQKHRKNGKYFVFADLLIVNCSTYTEY